MQLFVDVFGSTDPVDSDKEELCEVLKKSLASANAVAVEKITCSLNEVTSMKRDVRYVADMSYSAYLPRSMFFLE